MLFLVPGAYVNHDFSNGWGASIADALSTAILMELEDVVVEILGFLEKVDFSKTGVPGDVSLFETTVSPFHRLKSNHSH